MRPGISVGRCAGAVTLSATLLLTGESFAATVMYEPFAYTVGTQLVGQTNPQTGKQWLDPTGPGQPAAASDTQRILAGNLQTNGTPPAIGDSFSLPNLPNGNIARIELPNPGGYTYDTATSTGNAPNGLFMSMAVKVLQDTTFTTSNYFAGFHLGVGATGMTVSNGYAGMIYLRPDPLNASNYNFGVAKNNQTVNATNPVAPVIGWSSQSFGAGDQVHLVFQYQFATAAVNNDDTVNLWVNPDLDDPSPLPSATTSIGADGYATSGTPAVTTSILRSVYFRSNGTPATPSNLQVDEVRVALNYAEAIPEPASLGLLALSGIALGRCRRTN